MKFTHVVLTRFNVRSSNSSTPPSQEWMDKRILLFETYCFPSIVNQTNQNFKWIIYIDRETDPTDIATLESFSRNSSNILSIKLANSWEQVVEVDLNNDISKLIDDDTELLITSRLDNDDTVHKDFIGIIQSESLKQLKASNTEVDKFAINLTKGFCLQVDPTYELTATINLSNPFISLVERLKDKNNKFLTVIHFWHTEYADQTYFSTIQVNTIPCWIQIIHSTNICNQVIGYPVLDKNKLRDFGIEHDKVNLSSISYLNFVKRSIDLFCKRGWASITRRLKLIAP
jgi:Putative rhamnosyl transferase